jgi:hypothetical protein
MESTHSELIPRSILRRIYSIKATCSSSEKREPEDFGLDVDLDSLYCCTTNVHDLLVNLFEFEIKSQHTLEAFIDLIIDFAITSINYQRMIVNICKVLCERSKEWSFKYLRVIKLDKNHAAPAEAGWYFSIFGGSKVQGGEWQGPFSEKKEAEDQGYRLVNFQRLLLNRIQLIFSEKDPTVEEEAKDMEEKASWGVNLSMEDIDEFQARALRREQVHRVYTKKMVSNIAFICQLYLADIISSPILYYCCRKLLHADSIEILPSTDEIEALYTLLKIAGGKLEEEEDEGEKIMHMEHNHSSKKKMMNLFEVLYQKMNALAKLESRSCYVLNDLINLRAKKWIHTDNDHKEGTD